MNELPAQFNSEILGSLATIRRGITYSADMLVERDSGIPYINMKSFKKGGGFNPDGIKYFAGPFSKDDLSSSLDLFVVNTDVTLDGDIVGIPVFLPYELKEKLVLFSHHVTRLRLNKKIDSEYLFYLLCIDNYRRWMLRFARGTTVLMLDMTAIKKIPIVYHADKLLQNKIVTIFNSLDVAIEKTEALIEKYQQIKAGLMHDLFTRGIGADGKQRLPREQAPELYQQTPIGWIPKEWRVKRIGEVFSIQLGKMLSRAAKTGKNEYHYLGNKNVQWDKVEIENLESMDFHPSERKKFKLNYGDLLVCEGGDVGRTAMWREELDNCFYQKAIHRLRPMDSEVLPAYMLRFMFYAKNTGMFSNFTSQTSIAHLTREKLSSVQMIVPSDSEQEKLVARFEAIDQRIDEEHALLGKIQKQMSGLMHDLLTGKVQVIVDQPEAAHVD